MKIQEFFANFFFKIALENCSPKMPTGDDRFLFNTTVSRQFHSLLAFLCNKTPENMIALNGRATGKIARMSITLCNGQKAYFTMNAVKISCNTK